MRPGREDAPQGPNKRMAKGRKPISTSCSPIHFSDEAYLCPPDRSELRPLCQRHGRGFAGPHAGTADSVAVLRFKVPFLPLCISWSSGTVLGLCQDTRFRLRTRLCLFSLVSKAPTMDANSNPPCSLGDAARLPGLSPRIGLRAKATTLRASGVPLTGLGSPVPYSDWRRQPAPAS